MKQKSLTCFTALLLALTMAPAMSYTDVSVVKADDECKQGTTDGYDWELWNQNYTGNVSMQVGSNGTYSCSWSGIENCLFRSGKRLGSTKSWQDYGGIQVQYEVDYTPKGNSYMCIYGWTQNPLVEYYIVEAWGDWRPPGSNNARANITVDGKGYDVYTSTRNMQPSIEGTKTFEQYWSVQKTNPAAVNQKRTLKGTITVSDHFAAWERSGMKMGKMYEVALNVEGYRSSGEAQVKKNTLIMGEIPDSGDDTPDLQPVPTVTGSAPSGSGSGVSDDFEGSGTSWTGRGDSVSLKMATSFKNAGSKSLYVTGRTASWQGFQCSSSELKAGGSYSISMNVGYQDPNYDSAGFTVGVQYKKSGATDSTYDNIADATCSTGKWTTLGGDFTIPSGATDISLYVQTAYTENDTAADLIDFFIDNVKLTGDTGSSDNGNKDDNPPVSNDTTVKFGDLDSDKTVDLTDLTLLSQYLLSDVNFTTEQVKAADVTGDGSVDVADLALLKQFVMNDSVTLGGANANAGNNGGGNTNTDNNNDSNTNTDMNGTTPSGSGSGVTDSFEKSGTDWTGRGDDVSLKLVSNFTHSGSQALGVSGRTDSWQGFQVSSGLKAGNSYSLDVYVGYNDSSVSSKGFEFGVQYDDSTGTQYVNVASETVSSGKWGLLSGSFDIPSGASNISIYVQTAYTETPGASDLIDFYIDDAKLTQLESTTPPAGNGGNGGSTPSGVGSKGKVVNGMWTSNADTSWIDPNKPMVAISFDDGPIAGSQNPGRIQNALTKNGFHATFFYWGERIRGNEQEIKNAYNAGFEVANHTWSHPQLTQQGDKGKNEVYKCKQALDAIIGGDNDYLLRPPYLATDSGVCAAVGVPMPNCGLDTKDWDGASKDQILNTLKSALANGSLRNKVVLCHENYDSTAGAMEEFLPYLKSQGWQCVTVSEMFAAQGKTMQAGVVYDYVK